MSETRSNKARGFLAQDFLNRAGRGQARRDKLADDASNRKYDRLWQDGGTAVLMDAPPDKGEDVRPFVAIARALLDCGLSAPGIMAEDAENGFLLIEDLGDDLFARVIAADPSKEAELYRSAMQVLAHLHSQPPLPGLADYDAPLMADLSALAYDWYLGESRGKDARARESFVAKFDPILAEYAPCQVTILRDYHAENLIWLPDRDGVRRTGLLDFQDAMRGAPAYDVVSVLMDARRDVSGPVADAMVDAYCEMAVRDRDEFLREYHVVGAQRNLRILGVFARLSRRDGKAHYVDLIPRVWDHLMVNLAHPALAPVAEQIIADLPAPNAEILQRLRP